MTHDTIPAYGLWGLVIINTAVFIIFAFSFTKPKTSRDWRSFGAFSAFIVALFTERCTASRLRSTSSRDGLAAPIRASTLSRKCGTFVVNAAWSAWRSALERPAYAEHCGNLWRLHLAVGSVEDSL